MILSDKDIKKALRAKHIIISPFPDLSTQLGSVSIDLRLGRHFRVFEHAKKPFIDAKEKISTQDVSELITIKKNGSFILQPNDFVLAGTVESVTLPHDIVMRLEGRSSLGRMGIVVHSTASIFDPGWSGNLVLELGNLGRMPVVLYHKMAICAVTFELLTSSVEIPYSKKKSAQFVGQKKP